MRLLKRYASQVVLAFDADAAGQGAAQRFYEWEERYQVRVSVARFPEGKDPGDLSVSDPDALRARGRARAAVPRVPRCNRVLNSRQLRSPGGPGAGGASEAMAVVNEHPNANVRKLYAGQVATHVGLPVERSGGVGRSAASKAPDGARRAGAAGRRRRRTPSSCAVAMLLQRWDDIAPWLVEDLFADDVARRAFLAVAEAGGAIEPRSSWPTPRRASSSSAPRSPTSTPIRWWRRAT